MNDVAEILKYVLPSLVVGASTILTIKYFFDQEHKNRIAGLRDQNRSTVTPIRLQAYERIVLFLERIAPANLIIRANPTEMDARTLHKTLVQNIRDEYEHNLSLQIYLSMKAWELVKNGKEELIMVINQSASEINPEASGMDLAQKIFENYLKLEKQPLSAATDFLKREAGQFF
ncbi:MAG: hypothetical protein AB9842_13815 [Bacteroidales bacterium]